MIIYLEFYSSLPQPGGSPEIPLSGSIFGILLYLSQSQISSDLEERYLDFFWERWKAASNDEKGLCGKGFSQEIPLDNLNYVVMF